MTTAIFPPYSRLKNGQTHNLSYEYDGLDQLIRVNDQKANTTTLYTYDAGGNITSAKTNQIGRAHV